MKKRVIAMAATILLALSMVACGDVPVPAQNADAGEAVTEETVAEETVEEAEPEATVTEAVAENKTIDKKEESAEAKEAAEDALTESEDVNREAAADKEEADILENITKIEPAKKMYATQACNIRKGPSTEYDIVGHADFNQELVVVGQDKGGWYEIMLDNQPAFISHKLVNDAPVDMEALAALMATQPAPAAAAQTPKAQAAPVAPAAPKAQAAPVQVKAPAGVLFIGDSRCVQMREAVAGGGCSWICQNGARYEWFADTAIPQADPMVGKGTKVVICMGVNDTGDVGKYAALTNAKAAEWAARGAKVYYVSVNPVSENPYTSTEQVDNFNASIVGQLFGVKWIDTNTYLKGVGYNLVDGLHYDGPTYFKIFSGIISGLR